MSILSLTTQNDNNFKDINKTNTENKNIINILGESRNNSSIRAQCNQKQNTQN